MKRLVTLLFLSVNSQIESQVLDSGASFHSCHNRKIMENYISGDFGKVYLADDEPLKIVGKGNVWIKFPNELVWKLQGDIHIYGLKRNLILVGQLDNERYVISFGG